MFFEVRVEYQSNIYNPNILWGSAALMKEGLWFNLTDFKSSHRRLQRRKPAFAGRQVKKAERFMKEYFQSQK